METEIKKELARIKEYQSNLESLEEIKSRGDRVIEFLKDQPHVSLQTTIPDSVLKGC